MMNLAVAAKSSQLCPTLCDPTDGSPPDSSVPGFLQARILEWIAISFSMMNLESVLKSREIILPDKGLSSQSYGVCNSHVWM